MTEAKQARITDDLGSSEHATGHVVDHKANRIAEDLIAGRCPQGWTTSADGAFVAPEPDDDEIIVRIPQFAADGSVASFEELKLVRIAPGQWERVPDSPHPVSNR